MGQLIRIASVLALAVAARAQNRLLVPSQHPDLAAAVAAAQDGDTIELASGVQSTGGALITKSLNVVGANSILSGTLTITIPAGKALTMSGCTPGTLISAWVDLTVTGSAGRVTLAEGPLGWGHLQIVDSAQVLLRNFGFDDHFTAVAGGAVFVQGSDVSFDACVLHGAVATYYPSAQHALELVNARVSIANSILTGGDGYQDARGLAPGAAALIATNSILRCGRGVLLQAGARATEPALILAGGLVLLDPSLSPTLALNLGALVVRAPTPIVVGINVAAGSTASIGLTGTSGALGALLVGFPADRVTVPGVLGDLWLDAATMCVPRLGATASALGWSVPVPAVWHFPTEFRWQGLVLDNGTFTLTDPGAALLH